VVLGFNPFFSRAILPTTIAGCSSVATGLKFQSLLHQGNTSNGLVHRRCDRDLAGVDVSIPSSSGQYFQPLFLQMRLV
jgi:hypothetical protein